VDPAAAQPALIGGRASAGVLAQFPLSEAEGEQATTKKDDGEHQMQTDDEDDGIAAAKAKRALQAPPPGSQVPPRKRKAVEKAQSGDDCKRSDATDSEDEVSDFSVALYGAGNDTPQPRRPQRQRNQGRALNKKRRGGKR
jgi:hypothetical protein